MKKVFIITASVVAIGFSAAAKNLDESKVPAAVKASFEKKYSGQKAKWEKPDLK